MNDSYAIQDQLLKLARMYELDDLVDGIEEIKGIEDEKARAKIGHDLSFKFVEKARKDLDDFLLQKILGEKLGTEMDLKDDVDLEDIDCTEF